MQLRECSGSFEDVSSNTVICFRGIPKEFRGKMTVLLEISDKDPLYSHCFQIIDCPPLNVGAYSTIHTYVCRYVFDNTHLRLLYTLINIGTHSKSFIKGQHRIHK